MREENFPLQRIRLNLFGQLLGGMSMSVCPTSPRPLSAALNQTWAHSRRLFLKPAPALFPFP